jgi:hypothetical protein
MRPNDPGEEAIRRFDEGGVSIEIVEGVLN